MFKNHYIQGVLLIALLLTDLIITGIWVDLSKSDWATWVGAIFAGLAFGGTIYIATKAGRDREQEQWDTAVVLAAGVLERIGYLLRALQQLDKTIETVLAKSSNQTDPEQFLRTKIPSYAKQIYLALDGCPKVEMDELKGLLILPNRCAAHIAASAERVRRITDDMKLTSEGKLNPSTTVAAFLTAHRSNIAGSMISLHIAKRECRKVIIDVNVDIEFHFKAGTKFD